MCHNEIWHNRIYFRYTNGNTDVMNSTLGWHDCTGMTMSCSQSLATTVNNRLTVCGSWWMSIPWPDTSWFILHWRLPINPMPQRLDSIKQTKWHSVKFDPVAIFTVIPDIPRRRFLQLLCSPLQCMYDDTLTLNYRMACFCIFWYLTDVMHRQMSLIT